MLKKIKSKYIVVFLLSAVCFFSTLFYFFYYVHVDPTIDMSINNHWTANVNGKIYKDVELGNFGFDVVNRGDKIELYSKLPDKKFKTPAFLMYTWNTAFCVYCNNNRIYSYGFEDYNQKKLVGCGVFIIPLPENFQNQNIKIVMTVNENRAFSTIRPLKLGEMDSLCFQIVRKNAFAFFITMIMLLFGFVCICISAVFIFISKKFRKMFSDMALVGCLTFLSGCWSMCSFNFIYLFTEHSVANVYIEYGSLYLAYLPFLLIIFNREKYIFNEFVYKLLISAYTIFISLTVILQVTNIRHIPLMLVPFHILALITVIAALFVLKENKDVHKSDRILVIGFVIALLSVFLHMILFNIFKFFLKGSYHSISLLSVMGVFVLICSIFLSSVLYWRQHYISSRDRHWLNKLAHEDVLTGLYNRQKISEELINLQENNLDYCIIVMDLNNLKITNDSFGHQVGDMLLKEFSNCLKFASIPEITITSRVGGDEFLVILKNPSKKLLNEYILNLKNIVLEYNNSQDNLKISFAYGYACMKEVEKSDFNLVMRLADERMYDMKHEMKLNFDEN